MQSVSRTGAAILCLAVLALQSSHAQISNTPEMEELAASHGQADFFEIMPQMLEYYTNALQSSPRDGVEITMDLSYGPDARHVMDIHSPQQESGEPRPILVFIHGGGFIQGFKNTNDEIYGNIGNYFARAGYVTVNASYRLAPQHQWPAGIEDMAMLVSWLAGHVEEYGGDPERIFLMGQSAGAVHVAAYVFNEDFHLNNGDDGVAGAILVSGIYSITGSDYDKAYYGEDEGKWPDRAVIETVEGRAIPLFIIDVEYDPLEQQMSAVNLMARVCERDGTCPRRTHVQGHNHLTGILHFNTADDSYGKEIIEFIETGN